MQVSRVTVDGCAHGRHVGSTHWTILSTELRWSISHLSMVMYSETRIKSLRYKFRRVDVEVVRILVCMCMPCVLWALRNRFQFRIRRRHVARDVHAHILRGLSLESRRRLSYVCMRRRLDREADVVLSDEWFFFDGLWSGDVMLISGFAWPTWSRRSARR